MTHKAKLVNGKIESREPCSGGKASRMSDHCWHDTGGSSFTVAPNFTVTKESVCCFCEKPRSVKYMSRQPEGHGRFAPKELVQVSDTEER